MPKHTIWIAVVFTSLLVACGGGTEWTGKFSGETELQDGSGGKLEKGTGSATLETGLDNKIKFDKTSPLADCDIRFSTGSNDTGRSSEKRYKVKDADSIKCKASLGKGAAPVEISVQGGDATVKDTGEFSCIVHYSGVASGERRSFILTGTKGWF